MEIWNSTDPVPIQFTEVLDLHSFKASELGMLLNDYLDHAAAKQWTTVRIVHGKGIGNLRRTVEAFLAKRKEVESFRLAPSGLGGWGATIVFLKQNLQKSRIAFWLLPAVNHEVVLSRWIEELANRFTSKPFSPHLTLCTTTQEGFVGLSDIRPFAPLLLTPLELAGSDLFTKTFFIRFERARELQEMIRCLHGLSEDLIAQFDPHLSLLYGRLSEAERMRLLSGTTMPQEPMLFDRLAAVRMNEKIASDEDVASFKLIETIRLKQ